MYILKILGILDISRDRSESKTESTKRRKEKFNENSEVT
jgi:hypothetical protein